MKLTIPDFMKHAPRTSLWAVMAALFSGVIGLPPDDARGAGKEHDARVRVMSFNIRYANPRDDQNQWQFRKEVFSQNVRSFNPDLLGTQEVLAAQLEDLRKMLPGYTAVGVARDDGKSGGEWSAIFYRTERFEQLTSGTFWLSQNPEIVGSKGWDGACARICTWVRLRDRLTDKLLLHANTHFDHEGSVARFESAKLLAERLPQLAMGAGALLTGDFNCGEVDPPYKLLTERTPNGWMLVDSYRQLHPLRTAEEATFHGFKGTKIGHRIDWILHTPHFKPTVAEIIHTSGDPHPSDHYPITAIVEHAP